MFNGLMKPPCVKTKLILIFVFNTCGFHTIFFKESILFDLQIGHLLLVNSDGMVNLALQSIHKYQFLSSHALPYTVFISFVSTSS